MHDIRRRDVEPAMRAIRYLCQLQMPRWSMLVAPMCYMLFVLCILNLSFPLSSWGSGRLKTTTTTTSTVATAEWSSAAAAAAAAAAASNRLSNDVIEFRAVPERKYTAKELQELKVAFHSADVNSDRIVSIGELERYIHKTVVRHVQHGIQMNPICFARIDVAPRDGLVTWDEYHAYFLRQKGVSESYIGSHVEGNHVPLDRLAKEEMMRDKAQWNEAARTEPMSLTLDEFLAFRHPEASAVNLLSMVDDILRQFDEDGDDVLTLDEFTNVMADDLDDKWRQYVVNKSVQQRADEFKRLMDLNHDSRADRSELLKYIDPRNFRLSQDEAKFLIDLADENGDKRLTWNEMFQHAGIFTESKVLGRPESFHDAY